MVVFKPPLRDYSFNSTMFCLLQTINKFNHLSTIEPMKDLNASLNQMTQKYIQTWVKIYLPVTKAMRNFITHCDAC